MSTGNPEVRSARAIASAPFGISLPLITGGLAFLLAAFSRAVWNDPDSLWHLAAYRWMRVHGAVPMADSFSYTMAGTPWVAHEWGSELLLGLSFDALGWMGPQLVMAAGFAMSIAYITRYLVRDIEPLYALLIVAVSVANLAPQLLVRPHVLAWVLLVIWVGSLVRAVERKEAPTFWLLLVMLFWVNAHASFTLGIGLAGVLALDAVSRADGRAERTTVFRGWTRFVSLAVMVSMINPRGPGAILHAFEVMGLKGTLLLVTEWQSANFQEFQPLLLWLIPVCLLALGGRLRVGAMRAVIVCGVLYLALKHQRYHSLAGLLFPLLLATSLAESVRRLRDRYAPHSGAMDRVLLALTHRARPTSVALASILLLGVMALRAARYTEPLGSHAPAAALAVAQRMGLGSRVLNDYDFGGYLIWRDHPVFIDGRADMYGDAYVVRYAEAVTLAKPDALDVLLEQYAIEWTLLRPELPAAQYLDRVPQWRRVYADSQAVIHVRSSSF